VQECYSPLTIHPSNTVKCGYTLLAVCDGMNIFLIFS
jgi:hypothetical protein